MKKEKLVVNNTGNIDVWMEIAFPVEWRMRHGGGVGEEGKDWVIFLPRGTTQAVLMFWNK